MFKGILALVQGLILGPRPFLRESYHGSRLVTGILSLVQGLCLREPYHGLRRFKGILSCFKAVFVEGILSCFKACQGNPIYPKTLCFNLFQEAFSFVMFPKKTWALERKSPTVSLFYCPRYPFETPLKDLLRNDSESLQSFFKGSILFQKGEAAETGAFIRYFSMLLLCRDFLKGKTPKLCLKPSTTKTRKALPGAVNSIFQYRTGDV